MWRKERLGPCIYVVPVQGGSGRSVCLCLVKRSLIGSRRLCMYGHMEKLTKAVSSMARQQPTMRKHTVNDRTNHCPVSMKFTICEEAVVVLLSSWFVVINQVWLGFVIAQGFFEGFFEFFFLEKEKSRYEVRDERLKYTLYHAEGRWHLFRGQTGFCLTFVSYNVASWL